jgi:hypothetical protein
MFKIQKELKTTINPIPQEQSESKFSNAVFEKALGLRATFRNMKTVRRLAAKYPPR